MKKYKKLGIIIFVIFFVALIIFAFTRTYKDSHLKVEGIRVRFPSDALIVKGCNEKKSNIAYCRRSYPVSNGNIVLEFQYKDMKENGYPSTATASVNGHVVIERKGLNIEENNSLDYQKFYNVEVMGEYVVFTYTDGLGGSSTTLYAVDKDGNIVLEEYELDTDYMRINDYENYIKYEDNKIIIQGTRIGKDSIYNGKDLCKEKQSNIIEAEYTYTLKDGKFTKKRTKTKTIKEYIETNYIACE